MKAKELDVVRLTEDLPKWGLTTGNTMVVLQAYEEPAEAYDLEMITDEGFNSVFAYGIKPESFDVEAEPEEPTE